MPSAIQNHPSLVIKPLKFRRHFGTTEAVPFQSTLSENTAWVSDPMNSHFQMGRSQVPKPGTWGHPEQVQNQSVKAVVHQEGQSLL
jgi:hypothetical protein